MNIIGDVTTQVSLTFSLHFVLSSRIRRLERHDRWGRRPYWQRVIDLNWMRKERMALFYNMFYNMQPFSR